MFYTKWILQWNPELFVSDKKSPWLNQPKMALSSPTNSQSNSLNSKYLFLCILQTRGFEPNTKCGTLFRIKQPSSIKTYQITKQHILLWILNIHYSGAGAYLTFAFSCPLRSHFKSATYQHWICDCRIKQGTKGQTKVLWISIWMPLRANMVNRTQRDRLEN